MIRRILLLAALAMFCTLTVFAEDGITVMIDQEPVDFARDIPVIEEGRTLVPMRAIFESLGMTVDWKTETATAIARKGGLSVTITIGERIALLNGNVTALDVPARLINGRMYVPLRFIGESIGATVEWDAGTQIVYITIPKPPERTAVDRTGKYFGMSTSGESMGNHSQLYPLMKEAGISTIRAWPPWEGVEASNDEWKWDSADAILSSAEESGIEITGMLCYLPAWASASGGYRAFPIADIEYYRDYVRTTLTRYKDKVRYWEVYNEFNASAFAKNATVADYVQLTRETYTIAKEIDPGLQIGIGCADVDIAFLSNVLKEGGAGYVDFVAVHPYSVLRAAMDGREEPFLQLGANLREMLEANGESRDVGLWITEIGITSDDTPDRELHQAQGLIKAFILPLVQDFERIFWFEGKGPDYGSGDFGLLRSDWTKRPSYIAIQTMTGLLGADPEYIGWLNPTGDSYLFAFGGTEKPVIVSWADNDSDVLEFDSPVTVTGIDGVSYVTQRIELTTIPVFITDFPESMIQEAAQNKSEVFPWLKDYTRASEVTCTMGAENVVDGLIQIERGDGNTVTELVDGIFARRTNRSEKDYYMYFDVDDSFAGYSDNKLEITVYARQVSSNGTVDICYESTEGYKMAHQRWTPTTGVWEAHTFKVDNASFANNWGWNFRLDVQGQDVWVQKVEIRKVD